MGRITIALPIHPHLGQPVRVRQRYGREQLRVQAEDGHQLCIPVAWTDLRPRPPVPMLHGRPVRLATVALRALSRLVQDRRSPRPEQTPRPAAETLTRGNLGVEDAGPVRRARAAEPHGSDPCGRAAVAGAEATVGGAVRETWQEELMRLVGEPRLRGDRRAPGDAAGRQRCGGRSKRDT